MREEMKLIRYFHFSVNAFVAIGRLFLELVA
jgi:hypothetical protein